ncbi:uncharacterized protein TNCV_4836701 [Trichonephila clavipes]|nr:uncharacterized protein TNCV_4836701 [Trichonephila clavipes]
MRGQLATDLLIFNHGQVPRMSPQVTRHSPSTPHQCATTVLEFISSWNMLSPTENSLAVLNHKILEANSQIQNVKLGGHQTCLSINRLWHELCDMLRRLVGTTAPGHDDCSIQE